MGSMKDALDDGSERICPDCGYEMSENEDGKLECDNPNLCVSQVDAIERGADSND